MKMNLTTKVALLASIVHWFENETAKNASDVKLGPDECALCARFIGNSNCNGCPVAASTGQSGCHHTPYDAAERAYYKWHGSPGSQEAAKNFREIAKTEREFLQSLLP